MAKLRRVVIGSLSIVLAATAATAQQSGSTVSETFTTVRARDLNGAEPVSETVVTRTTTGKDTEEVVIETHGLSMNEGRLTLTQRVRRVTTVTSDGSRTVEDTEEPPLGSLHSPLRVIRRSVTTVRRSGPDSYVAEEQVFDRDLNGRLVHVQTNIERSSRN